MLTIMPSFSAASRYCLPSIELSCLRLPTVTTTLPAFFNRPQAGVTDTLLGDGELKREVSKKGFAEATLDGVNGVNGREVSIAKRGRSSYHLESPPPKAWRNTRVRAQRERAHQNSYCFFHVHNFFHSYVVVIFYSPMHHTKTPQRHATPLL